MIATLLLFILIAVTAGCSKKLPEPLPDSLTTGHAHLPDGKGGIHKVGVPYKVGGRWYKPVADETAYDETGIASWYGRDFHGKHTANGETYDMHALSAAHKTLPLPTLVRVTNLENGRSVIVRVNDRGPFVKERLIDLSYAAAKQLGYADRGTARVRVQTLDMPAPKKTDRLASAAKFRLTRQPHAKHTSASGRPTRTGTASPLSGRMFIQLGAFSSQDNAIRLQNKLKANFPTIRATEINLSGKILYRVRMGPFEDTTNVEQTILSLQHKGFQKPVVIIQ